MRHNFINAAARLQSSGWGPAVRLPRVIASDNGLLCPTSVHGGSAYE